MALPVCVVERLGPIASLRRSARLTRGCRWTLFGIFLLVSLAGGAMEGVAATVLPGLAGTGAATHGVYLCAALLAGAQAVVVAVTYIELRGAKDGIDAVRLATAFD